MDTQKVKQTLKQLHAELEEIEEALVRCDLFVAIGTSGHVYPAAGFVELARRAHTLELNLEPSLVGSRFRSRRYGPAGETVPQLVDELLALASA